MDKETASRSRSQSRTSGVRKKSARARRRQRVILLIIALVVLLIGITAIVGMHIYKKWETRFDTDRTTIFVLEDGKVVTTDVEKFDTTKYDQGELGAFIKHTIATYNQENPAKKEDAVTLESYEVTDGTATLTITYADAATYADFTDAELFVGTIAEAVAAGYKFDSDFATIVDGYPIASSKDQFLGQTELKVAIFKANTKVSVEGKIAYVSAENVAEVGDKWVITEDGHNLLNKKEDVDTQATEDTETSTEESTEETDGVVDGTELVTEEESTEIIFDFGDEEEVEDSKDSYSEVYTYIIYR